MRYKINFPGIYFFMKLHRKSDTVLAVYWEFLGEITLSIFTKSKAFTLYSLIYIPFVFLVSSKNSLLVIALLFESSQLSRT